MAIFTGNWFDGSGVPFDGSAAAIVDGPAAGTARLARATRTGQPSEAHRNCMCRFGWISRHWKQDLTGANRLTWQDGEGLADDRRDDVVEPENIRHWMNAQFSTFYWNLNIQPTDDMVDPYIIQDLELAGAYEWTQSYTVRMKLSQQGSWPVKSTLHISPVPKERIETAHLWRYARWTKSHSLVTSKIYPLYDVKTYSAPAIYPLVRYETAQVYVRVSEFKNHLDPVTKQESRTVTYGWAALTCQVSAPP